MNSSRPGSDPEFKRSGSDQEIFRNILPGESKKVGSSVEHTLITTSFISKIGIVFY